MPESDFTTALPEPDVDDVLTGYMECALWSESIGEDFAAQWAREKDEDEPAPDTGMDSFGFERDSIAPEAIASMREDVEAFLADESLSPALAFWGSEHGDRAIGHDFWLTRNRHGAGFWDRWSSGTRGYHFGRALTDAAHPFGESHLYVGDDLETIHVA
jgi:hypothetical protein